MALSMEVLAFSSVRAVSTIARGTDGRGQEHTAFCEHYRNSKLQQRREFRHFCQPALGWV
jgi:hypothetical protein